MSFTKKLTSVILSLCMVLSLATVAIVPAAAETTVETYAQDTIQGSNILHCFDWSYNNIKANLPDIAKAGYTAVQTSPVQSPKDYNASWTDGSGQWWKLYQPLGFSVSNNTWLGTKAELTSLCVEAEKYNIKVVVDIVANHLANNGASGGTFSNLNSGVDSDLKNPAYYHSDSNGTSDDSRYTITQRHLGMPDLNTGNSVIQQKVLDLLKECVDCGVDGFRFDAAKHIEVPTDDSSCKSDFWPTVLDGVKNYASGKDLYVYGEILGSAGTDILNYTKYMDVTDNYTGDRALDKAYFKAAGELADGTYYKGASAADSVLWVESHDTYMGNSGTAWVSNTSGVSDDVIKKAWAVVGARADSTSLFFARPNSTMGLASTDTTWKSTEVAEVNKFKNHFEGTSEYLASSGSVAYVERGTKGVVISKLDGAGSVNLDAHQMADGTYTDQVSGSTFTVSGGKISGTVGSSGVAVVYNTEDSSFNYITASKLYLYPQLSSWSNNSPHFSMYLYNAQTSAYTWVSMTDNDGDGVYEAAVPNDNQWTNVIFCRMKNSATENNWNNKSLQTDDLYPSGSNDLFSVTAKSSSGNYTGVWSVQSEFEIPTGTSEEPTSEPDSDTYTIYVTNNAGWDDLYIYAWDVNGTALCGNWPGTKATLYSGSSCYTYDIPNNANGIIFNNGSGKQTGNITGGIENGTHWIVKDYEGNYTTAPTYYLTGTITNWEIDENYAFSLLHNGGGSVEYVLYGVELKSGDLIKVRDNNTYYPDGTDNHKTVETDGVYDIYFRPNADGNDDWHEKYFYLAKYHTITWVDGDNVPIAVDVVANGETPQYNGETPTKTGDAQYTYIFNGNWSPDITAATDDTTYTAQFDSTVNTYTVVWKDYNGNVLETDENVAYGTIPEFNGTTPTRPSTDNVNYVFAGWTPNVSPVTGDVTYIAQYTNSEKKYTVTWLDDDGTVLETDEDVTAGSTPSYDGETPTKQGDAQYTYTFSGWSPEIQPVSGNATYTAKYTQSVKEYDITWKNYDATEIKTDKVAYGVTPTYTGENPAKPADAQYNYVFTGWTPEIVSVTGDAEYTAQFTPVLNKYNVTFKNEDGTVLEEKTVDYGETPTYTGETPEKASTLETTYTFAGWTPSVASVTGEVTYTATYTEAPSPKYNVSVINSIGWDKMYVYYWKSGENNSWPGTELTADNNFIFAAQVPEGVDGIIFNNGSGSQTGNIEDNIEGHAQWNVSLYNGSVKVNEVPTYYLAGTFTDPQWNKDYSPVFSSVKNKDGFEEYKLSGVQLTAGTELKVIDSNGVWFPSDNVNYTVTADGTYDVYFRRNADGDDGWFYNYFSLTNVTPYTITWVDGNGDTIKIDTVIHGETPSYNGTTPVKNSDEQYTYTFKGWSPEIAPATENKTYIAVFDQSVNTYNVIWQNYDGTELANEVYEYGEMPNYKGESPTRASSEMYDYTFAGWTPTVDTVTKQITYIAVYTETERKYTVTFVNWNGDTLYTQEVTYNAYPYYQGDTPQKESDTEHDYLFEGQWSPNLDYVTHDVTYTAQFTEYPRTYRIAWYDDNGTLLSDSWFAYGTIPFYPGQTPTKASTQQYYYEFSGWTPEIQPVTGDASYTAQYNEILNTYPVTWYNYDGTYLGQTFVDYGAMPVYNGTPERSADDSYHYNFTGWTPELTPVTDRAEYTAVFTQQEHQFDEPVAVWGTDYQNVEVTYHCSDCGFDAHHLLNNIEFAVDTQPGCETPGSGHYYAIDRFGSYDYEIRSEQIEIPAHGHHYGEPVWSWAEDGASATATFTCTECDKTRIEAAVIDTTYYSAPGCDYQGSANYKAVVNLDGAVYEDTHGVIIPATGHSWGQPTWSWSIDRQFATATFECANCHLKNSYTDDNVQVEYSSEKTTRTATVYFFGEPYSDTIEEDPVQFNINWFSEGSLIKTDSVTYGTTPVYDGETPTKAADSASHYTFTGWQPEIQPAYSNADYYAVFTPESHQYSEPYSVDWNIDSKYVEITYRCSVCGHEEIHRVILSESNFVVDTPSTCTVQGTGHYHVNDMNVSVDSDPVAIPVTDHSYGQPEWSWADDYKSATATFTCGICGDVQRVITTDVAVDYQNDKTVYTAKAVFNGIEYRNTAEADAKLFAGHSLTLNGDIGVNFFINISEEDVDRGVTVDFEWNVEGNIKRSSYKLDKVKDFVRDHRYKATCNVAAAEMTYIITAKVTVGGVVQDEVNYYSVKQYADRILNDSTFISTYVDNYGQEKYNKLNTLVKAMLDYGANSQIRFVRNVDEPANGGTNYLNYEVTADMIDAPSSVMSENLEKYGLAYQGSTIVYLTETTLRHYYKITDNEAFSNYKNSIKVDGETVNYGVKDDMIYYDVKNIAANDLAVPHIITIGDDDYSYSALSYTKKQLASTTANEIAKELGRATYRYYIAANDYFG